jgi:hypothetical protein
MQAETPDLPAQNESAQPVAEAGAAGAAAVAPIPDDIQILNVGYETGKLEPIIKAIVKSKQKSECSP